MHIEKLSKLMSRDDYFRQEVKKLRSLLFKKDYKGVIIDSTTLIARAMQDKYERCIESKKTRSARGFACRWVGIWIRMNSKSS